MSGKRDNFVQSKDANELERKVFMNEERMDMLITAIRYLRANNVTLAAINQCPEEIKLRLIIIGLTDMDDDFFESVKKAIAL